MRFHKEDGQAMVEFALVLPIFILLLGGIIDFGWIFGNQILANNACRDVTRYTAINYKVDLVDDDEQIAEDRIKAELPAVIFDPDYITADLSIITDINGVESANLSLSARINVLTPILSTFLGDTYTIVTDYTMRIEDNI